MLDMDGLNMLAAFNIFLSFFFYHRSTLLKRGKKQLIIPVKPELQLKVKADDPLGLTIKEFPVWQFCFSTLDATCKFVLCFM